MSDLKKLICVLLMLTVLPIICGAAAEEEYYSPTYGTFYATRTRLYCGNQPDEYAYWTRNDTQKALLGIFLKDDFSLEDYHAYNHCFPNPGLFAVLSCTGERAGGSIIVLYQSGDGDVSLEYNPDSGIVTYRINYFSAPGGTGLQFDTEDQAEHFRRLASGYAGSFDSVFYSYYDEGFFDPVPEYSDAAELNYEFRENHPDLYDYSPYIGY